MRRRGIYILSLLVLPFLAIGVQADSISGGTFYAADAVTSPAQTGSFAALDTTTVLEGSPFAVRRMFMSSGTNVGCRRDLAQDVAVAPTINGNKFPGCDDATGVIYTWGLNGGTTAAADPLNQTTPVPDPSTLLLVATGLIGGVVRMRHLMARS